MHTQSTPRHWAMMKALLTLLFTLALTPAASAREPVSVDFFYENLEDYGDWRETDDYGYCWQPRGVDRDWRPYADGRWVSTEAGWTWDSDEPYGWAVYHYGRWVEVEDVGWLWIPGTEWGPGWVSWRHSPRYVGWAPLPPAAIFLRSVGLRSWVDERYDMGPGCYRFVQARDFGSRRLRSVFIDFRENTNIIHQTTNITNITIIGDYVHNGGPRYDDLYASSTLPIRRLKLNRRQDFGTDDRRVSRDRLHSRVEGDSLTLPAPRIGGKSSRPGKLGAKLKHSKRDHGWKHSGSNAEIERTRDHMKAKNQAPADGSRRESAKDKADDKPSPPERKSSPPERKSAEHKKKSNEERSKPQMPKKKSTLPEHKPTEPEHKPSETKRKADKREQSEPKSKAKNHDAGTTPKKPDTSGAKVKNKTNGDEAKGGKDKKGKGKKDK